MQEHFEINESLWAYEKAETIMKEKGVEISAELPNNIGVLKTKLGKLKANSITFVTKNKIF